MSGVGMSGGRSVRAGIVASGTVELGTPDAREPICFKVGLSVPKRLVRRRGGLRERFAKKKKEKKETHNRDQFLGNLWETGGGLGLLNCKMEGGGKCIAADTAQAGTRPHIRRLEVAFLARNVRVCVAQNWRAGSWSVGPKNNNLQEPAADFGAAFEPVDEKRHWLASYFF